MTTDTPAGNSRAASEVLSPTVACTPLGEYACNGCPMEHHYRGYRDA